MQRDGTALLAALGTRLSAATSPDEVARATCQAALDLVAARTATLLERSPDGAFSALASAGHGPLVATVVQRIPAPPPDNPAAHVARTGQPMWIGTPEEREARFGPSAVPLENRAWAVLPAGRLEELVLVLGFGAPRAFGAQEQTLLQAVAALGGQAHARATLAAREKEARAAAEVRAKWATLQAGVSDLLAAADDEDAALDGLAKLLVPSLGTCVAVDVMRGGERKRVALAAAPDAPAGMEAALRHVVPESPMVAVLRGGPGGRLPQATREFVARLAGDAAHVPVVEPLEGVYPMTVPIRHGGTTFAGLLFVRKDGPYCDEEQAQAQEVARRAALAVAGLRLQASLRAAAEARTEALQMIAHDIRNPLGAAMLRAQTLTFMGLSGPQADSVQVLLRSLQRIEDLTAKVLEVVRLDAGRLELEASAVDLAQVTRDAIGRVQPILEQAQAKVELDLGQVTVMADPERLRQAIENLVTNAAKFSPPDRRIMVSVRSDGPAGSLEVRDEGYGWAAEHAARIFKPFSRPLRAPSFAAGPGTGLGLYFAKGVAEALGGSLSASSAGVDKGSSFILRLPRPPQVLRPQ